MTPEKDSDGDVGPVVRMFIAPNRPALIWGCDSATP